MVKLDPQVVVIGPVPSGIISPSLSGQTCYTKVLSDVKSVAQQFFLS